MEVPEKHCTLTEYIRKQILRAGFFYFPHCTSRLHHKLSQKEKGGAICY